jgi:hypothetical protein
LILNEVVEISEQQHYRPGKSGRLSGSTMLMSLFINDGSLHEFIKHLYRCHGVVTVADWRASPRNFLYEYSLDPVSQKIFTEKLGSLDRRAPRGEAKLLAFRSR